MFRPLRTVLVFCFGMVSMVTPTTGAEGDQFLDGIGETALVARYRFEGNLQDASRNSLHASMDGGVPLFVEDKPFGTVLLLPEGGDHPHLRMPGQALDDMDCLSVTGWINVSESTNRQSFVDLGTDAQHRFHCTYLADREQIRFRTALNLGTDASWQTAGVGTMDREWIHLASVLDAVERTLLIYVNGHLAGRCSGVTATLGDLLDPSDPNRNQLRVGGAWNQTGHHAATRLHDVRFYRTALTDRQVATIHHNATSDEGIIAVFDPSGIETESYRIDRARLLAGGLVGVENLEVETPIGCLPHLPFALPGLYRDPAGGPPVRVIWPAPRDNISVLKPGTYTVVGSVPGANFSPTATVRIVPDSTNPPAFRIALESFPLGQVVLDPDPQGRATPLMKHRDKFIQGLAATDPDRFLYNFRDAFGRSQPEGTEPLRGWDGRTTRLRGHASGHYLTAIAQACASTSYDPELQAVFTGKVAYMVAALDELAQIAGKPVQAGGPCNGDPLSVPPGPGKAGFDSDLSQEGIRTDYWNWGEGFISGYPPDQFIMLEHGASYGTANDQIWAPYYTLHKILTGLMDCHEVAGNSQALYLATGMGRWVHRRLQALSAKTRAAMWSRYIAGEYGGMNEAMARLFRITGDFHFLECARFFDNTTFFFGDSEHGGGLACNVDTIRGRHANQHIPQITGALEVYRSTRNPAYYRVAKNFWELCTHHYMYSIGGVAGARTPNNAECFTAEPDTLFRNGLSAGGQNETCATYNLLKLARRLFMWERDAGYMDYYERALFNHILASVAEHDAGNTYHVPLNPGAVKRFGNAQMDAFTCCNGTALESATKLQNTIYLKQPDDRALYVNLYVSSSLTWPEQNVVLRQTTEFPYSDTVTLTVAGAGEFEIHVRVPNWATQGFVVKINGERLSAEARPGTYLPLHRNWVDGDTIVLTMPMDFRLLPLMDQPHVASLFYGPVLLAAEELGPRSTWRQVALDLEHLGSSLAGDPRTLRFEVDGSPLKPFYETYGRHSVYLDIVPRSDASADEFGSGRWSH